MRRTGMKRLITVLCCSFAVFGITACGAQNMADQEEAAESGNEIEIINEAEKREGMDSIKETGKLIVCTSPDYAPFEFEDLSREGNDRYVGADMSLAGYLAEQMGVELEIRAMEFEDCLKAVNEKTADLGLMGMLPEQERLNLVEFTDVYYNEGSQSMLVLEERLEEFPDLASFSGLKVAAQNGTVQSQLVVEQLPESYMEVVASVETALPMLRNKMVDGIAVPTVVAEKLIGENTDLASAPEKFDYVSEGLVGCVSPDEPELKKTVNDIIAEVTKSGIYYEWMDEAYRLAAFLNGN